MELVFFIYLIILGCLVLFTESKLLLKYVYIPSAFIFLIIVRISGYDVDIKVYASSMENIDLSNIYYLKEFVFWYGSHLVYIMSNNALVSFLILDLIWLSTLIYISNYNKNDGFLIIILLTSFPLFFGYENIYRQLYATIFALLSYTIINESYKKSIFIYIISVFMHNIMLFLLPIFIMKNFFNLGIKYRIFFSLAVTVIIVSLLSYFLQFKSASSTGQDMSLAYLLMFVCFVYILLIKFNFNIINIIKKIPSLFNVLIFMILLQFTNADMISERMGMVFLIFVIYDLYLYSNSINHSYRRKFFRIGLLLLFSLPVLVFSSSRSFFI
jgi:hypothetical protein